jgi:hypothetical protein
MAKKCEFQKKSGERCGADAQISKSVCVFQDPDRAADGRRAMRRVEDVFTALQHNRWIQGPWKNRAVEESKGRTFPLHLNIPQAQRYVHFSHRPGYDGLFQPTPSKTLHRSFYFGHLRYLTSLPKPKRIRVLE